MPLVNTSRSAESVLGKADLNETYLGKINLPAQSEGFETGDAIEAMYSAFMSTPKGSAWLVCTGPLTNAFLLLSTYEEEICEHLAGVCFMGGAIASGNCNSGVEFNMLADPFAAKMVIETWGPKLNKLVMMPHDVTETASVTKELRMRVQEINSPLSLTIS